MFVTANSVNVKYMLFEFQYCRLFAGIGSLLFLLKQGIVLKARSDWLLKLRTSFAIHLRGTRAEFAPKIVVIVAGTDELK